MQRAARAAPSRRKGRVRPPEAIIFDWDNTLVDTWPVIHAALAETFEHFGREPWSLDYVRRNVRRSLRDAFPVLFGDTWRDATDVFYAAFERRHLDALVAAEGADEMLHRLFGTGIPLSLVSNKTGRYLRQEATHLGWDGYFHRVVGAGDAARDKPAPDPVHLALDGSGIDAGESVWFVGDAGIDMQIAHETGCLPVLMCRDTDREEEFSDFQPVLRVTSCGDLAERVLDMISANA